MLKAFSLSNMQFIGDRNKTNIQSVWKDTNVQRGSDPADFKQGM